jgi:hypothetical protein
MMNVEDMGPAQRQEVVETNRIRYLAALKELPEDRRSPNVYFGDKHGRWVRQFDPEGVICPNGLALLGLGVTDLGTIDPEDRKVLVESSLGYDDSQFKTIDELNERHTLAYMREYIETEAMKPDIAVPLADELRVIPAGFSLEQYPGVVNWYYCPMCGEWLGAAVRVERSTKTQRFGFCMTGGNMRVKEDGRNYYFGGMPTRLEPATREVTTGPIEWRCGKCNQNLPESYTSILNETPMRTQGLRYQP